MRHDSVQGVGVPNFMSAGTCVEAQQQIRDSDNKEMTRLPAPQPGEDAMDQRARIREQRVIAPIIFGIVLGAAAASLIFVVLIAFQVHYPRWLADVVLYGFMLIVGPLTLGRYTKRHPNWVETGIHRAKRGSTAQSRAQKPPGV